MKDNFFDLYLNKWGRIASIVCFAALVLLMSSCLDDDGRTDPIPVAYVSIYHASPNAPEVDVYVDERPVNRLEFTDYTGYLNFYTGDRKLKVNPFNANNALIDTTVTFVDGGFYSVFIVDSLSDVEALTIRDSASAPAEGKAKIRFINLSPDATAFDVTLNDDESPLFANQAFKDPSDFIEVSAEESSFVVKAAGGADKLVSASDVDIRPGRFYTVIARGFVNPPAGNNNTLSVEVIRNN
jgi:hypothetical protein